MNKGKNFDVLLKQTSDHFDAMGKRLERDMAKRLNDLVEKRVSKMKMDLNSILMGASNRAHSKILREFTKGVFKDVHRSSRDELGLSVGQVMSQMASELQRNISRNL